MKDHIRIEHKGYDLLVYYDEWERPERATRDVPASEATWLVTLVMYWPKRGPHEYQTIDVTDLLMATGSAEFWWGVDSLIKEKIEF